MASPAQVLANRANARRSTGPKTAEGKQRSSQNNRKHGLTLGILAVDPAEQFEFCEFEASVRAEWKPEGFLECETLQQFLDAAWRLRKIHAIVEGLIAQYEEDPFVHPDTQAQLNQLTRYRSAAEMVAFRAIRTIRELQTIRLARAFHLTPEEQAVIPPLCKPATKMLVEGKMYGHNDREIFYDLYGAEYFTGQFHPEQPDPVPESGDDHCPTC